ncbi:MAG: flippase [Mobilitalea sp.]
MAKTSLKSNAVLNTVKTVLGIVFPLITFPYISRVLQVEAIGVYNFSSSIISYFILLAGLGVTTYAIREGSQYREDRVKISRFVSEVFSINMLSTTISYICLVVALLSISKLTNYSFAISILSIEIFFSTLGVSWVCNIFEDFLFIAIQSFAVQAVSLVLTFLLVKNPDDIYKYIAIVAFSKSSLSVINFVYVQKKYCHFRWVLHCNLKKHIKPILVIFSTSVAMTIYVSCDITMLGFMTTDYQVGLYSTAVKIYTIIKSILAAALVVLVPRFSILLQKQHTKEASVLFTKIFNILVVLVLPAVTGLFITSKDVIHLVGREKYLDGTLSLQLLCFAIAFSLIATLYTQCVLIPKKKEKIVFQATGISAIVNFALNFIFIPWLGIDGAAITTIIAEMIVCFMSVYYSKNDIHLEDIKKNLFTVIIGCIVIILVGLLSYNFIDTYYIRLFVAIVVSSALYLSVLLISGNPVAKSLLDRYIKK